MLYTVRQLLFQFKVLSWGGAFGYNGPQKLMVAARFRRSPELSGDILIIFEP